MPAAMAPATDGTLPADPSPAVLVVDDEPRTLGLAADLLRRLGFTAIDGCADAAAALERLRAKPYALVLCDLDLAGMDGLALLREIRADAALAGLPFVLTEAAFAPDEIRLARRAGASAILLKPYDRGLLRAKLRHALDGRPPRRQAADAEVSPLALEFPMLGGA